MTESVILSQTPLYSRHLGLKGRMVDFGGFSMPMFYEGSGIIKEHVTTRQSCGFFDVSHMGEFRVHGPDAFKFLQRALTNDIAKLSDGQMQYHLICDASGCALDDVLLYRNKIDDYYLIVNASNIRKDFNHLNRLSQGYALDLLDQSAHTCCIAVQGPSSASVLSSLFGWPVQKLQYYHFSSYSYEKDVIWVSRSGYTGEDGFELFCHPDKVLGLWDTLIEEGADKGAIACGLGSRNTLRLEAGNVLYGHELDERISVYEAGLGFAVALSKGQFEGRESLVKAKESQLNTIAAFVMQDRSIAREGYEIVKDGKNIGYVTSGSYAPTINASIGLALLPKELASVGQQIQVKVHSRLVDATIVKKPFVAIRSVRKRT